MIITAGSLREDRGRLSACGVAVGKDVSGAGIASRSILECMLSGYEMHKASTSVLIAYVVYALE